MIDITADARAWFEAHPGRAYHVRPATHEEVAELRDAGMFDHKHLAPGCFIYALFKIDTRSLLIEGRLAVLEARSGWAEDDCKRVWQSTEQRQGVMQ